MHSRTVGGSMWNAGTIHIPSTVTSVGSSAFYYADQATIYVPFKEGEKPDGWNSLWTYLRKSYHYLFRIKALFESQNVCAIYINYNDNANYWRDNIYLSKSNSFSISSLFTCLSASNKV